MKGIVREIRLEYPYDTLLVVVPGNMTSAAEASRNGLPYINVGYDPNYGWFWQRSLNNWPPHVLRLLGMRSGSFIDHESGKYIKFKSHSERAARATARHYLTSALSELEVPSKHHLD